MTKIESAYKEMMEDVQMSGSMIAYCMKDKALELERELTAALEEIKELDEELHTHVTRLSNSLNEVTEQRDGLRSGIDYASDQLTKVTEQRDSYKDRFESLLKRYAIETHQLTEQRDRLAEALERILDYQGRFAEEEPESIAKEALKSLITNK